MKLKLLSSFILSSALATTAVFADDDTTSNNQQNTTAAATQPAAPAASTQAAATTFNSSQTQAIQGIVKQYLLDNPDILIAMSQKLQADEQSKQQAKAEAAISQNIQQILNSASPVAGNPKAPIALVEFFDYQCVHCKDMTGVVEALLKANPNLRVILKEFPIFGGTSTLAAKAALAANMQGQDKFWAFHHAIMSATPPLNEAKIFELAKKAGLDVAKLKKDMTSPAVQKELDDNRALAEKLGILGTPSFVLSDGKNHQFLPGAAPQDAIQKMLDGLQGQGQQAQPGSAA